MSRTEQSWNCSHQRVRAGTAHGLRMVRLHVGDCHVRVLVDDDDIITRITIWRVVLPHGQTQHRSHHGTQSAKDCSTSPTSKPSVELPEKITIFSIMGLPTVEKTHVPGVWKNVEPLLANRVPPPTAGQGLDTLCALKPILNQFPGPEKSNSNHVNTGCFFGIGALVSKRS